MAEAHANSAATISRYLTELDEIAGVFRTLRDQRAELSLRFEDHGERHTARVLDVDGGRFLLDDIKPRSGLALLNRAVPFSFTARSGGLSAFADGLAVEDIATDRGVPYFLVPLPSRLLTHQRRAVERFRLPLDIAKRKGAAIVLHHGEQKLQGRIVDISAGGCRAEFDGLMVPPLAVDETMERCIMRIPHLLEIEARCAVRHRTALANPPRVVCGLEFLRMSVSDRRRLELLIQRLSDGAAVRSSGAA